MTAPGVFGEGSQLCGTPGFAPCEDELCERCNQQRGPQVFEIDVALVDDKPALTANQRMHWAAKARLVAAVRYSFAWRVRADGIRPQRHVTVQLHFQPQDRRRRDPSNLMPTQKACVDGLVDAGVVPDDTPQFVTELMPVILRPSGGPKRMWLTVEVAG